MLNDDEVLWIVCGAFPNDARRLWLQLAATATYVILQVGYLVLSQIAFPLLHMPVRLSA